MFETCYMMKLTKYACDEKNMDVGYIPHSYDGLKKHFDPTKK